MSEDDYKRIFAKKLNFYMAKCGKTSADPLTRQSAGRMAEHKKEPPHYWDNVTADTKIKGVCV